MSRIRVLCSPRQHKAENPYVGLLNDAVAEHDVVVEDFSLVKLWSGDWDVWHVHWPERLVRTQRRSSLALAVARFLLSLIAARVRRVAVVWTVHNLEPHDSPRPRLELAVYGAFIRSVSGVLSLSEAGLQAAHDRYPRLRSVPARVVPHGHYRAVYAREGDEGEARRRLGVRDSGPVVGYFGLIRPYKGVEDLLAAFRRLPDPQLSLVVSGRPHPPEMAATILGAAGDDTRVHLNLAAVPPDDVRWTFKASTLIVLPFKQILNSGSALLALSFDRPVLVPRQGSLSELADHVGGDWVRTYDGALTPDVLAEALSWATAPRPREAPLDEFEWRRVGALTAEAYKAFAALLPESRTARRLSGGRQRRRPPRR